MAVLATFLLLCVCAGTLLILARIIKKYVGRTKARRTTCASSRESEPLQPVIDGDETETLKTLIERLGEAEESSGPEFKFSFRFPDVTVRRAERYRHDSTEHEAVDAEEEEVLGATTSTISNYRLVAERNISGFMVQTEGLSCRVQESFVVDSGLSSLPNSHKIEERETEESSVEKDEGIVLADEPEDEEETAFSVGRDAANEFTEHASNPDGGFLHTDEPLDKDQRNCRKSDEDDKTLASEPGDKEETAFSVGRDAANEFTKETSNPDGGFFHTDQTEDKDKRNYRKSDEDDKTLANEVEDDGHGFMLFDSDGRVVGHGSIDKQDDCGTEEESEPMVSSQATKALQSKPDVVLGHGKETPTSDRFLTEEDFDEIGLDSCSISTITNDGYSVGSFIIDADSDDGFLSDVDLCGLEEEEDDGALHHERQPSDGVEDSGMANDDAWSQDSMNSWLGHEEEEARQFHEEEKHIDQVIQEAKLVISRLSSSVERPDEFCQPDIGIVGLDPLEEAYSEECGDELEEELRDLEREAEAEMGQDSVSRKEEEVALPHLSSSDEELDDMATDGLSSPIAATYHIKTHSDQSDEEEEEVLLPFHLPNSETIGDGSPAERSGKTPPSEELRNAEKNDDEKREEEENHGKAAAGAGKKGESDELEALWEHQDLIEQLSEELMFVRSAGLETIHEEPRSPNLAVKLGDWKFDAAFLHEKPNDELQAFYKIYRERMRKLDILNYQKMYAMDFLRPKDLPQSLGRRKPKVASLLAHNLLSGCRRKPEDRSERFEKELHGGLENVYVGQTCLSWEFLSWQYEKAQVLPKSNPYSCRQYNRVADEFRHFQVLIRRFLENEAFQVGRVPNYVRCRRDLTDLLQVPVIKEDGLKGKKVDKGNEAITLEGLNPIMVKSIILFWQFVKKGDKDEKPSLVKGVMGSEVELQDSTDGELMEHVKEQLHKKEKKLKDVLRVGNCLVKKFKRPEEHGSNQDQFFTQVDVKLISRVLQMPRLTTEQLVWCHSKLSNITIVGRNVHRETAFLPFPCST